MLPECMSSIRPSPIEEASCGTQQRLFQVIGRLASLASHDLESADLSRLEALITQLERSSKRCLEDTCSGFQAQMRICEWIESMSLSTMPLEGDASDTSSRVSWTSDESAQDTATKAGLAWQAHAMSPSLHLTSVDTWVKDVQQIRELMSPRDLDDIRGAAPSLNTPMLDPRNSASQSASLPHNMQTRPATVEVDVLLPDGHVEGTCLTIGYAGQLYEIAAPVHCVPGGTFRVPLLV